MAASAMTAMVTVLNGKSAALNNPNAAPLFRTCVMFMNPDTTSTLALSGTVDRTIAFVSWSSATIAIGSPISRRRGETGIWPAVSSDMSRQRVLAALAEPRPFRVGGHARHVAPAPLTLDAAGTLDDDAALALIPTPAARRPTR